MTNMFYRQLSSARGILLTLISGSLLIVTGCQTQKPSAPATASAPEAAMPTSPMNEIPVFNGAVRIKAGQSNPCTDSAGQVWLPDQGFEGGDVVARDAGTPIANTKDPGLFLSEHYAMDAFACKIPNGRYVATLYFAETFDGITGPGERVFSFSAQGHEFKDFDVWVKAGGPDRALVETVPVEVTNGMFRIDFTRNIENPEINAIAIIPAT